MGDRVNPRTASRGPQSPQADAAACFLDDQEAEQQCILICGDERRVLGTLRKYAYLSAERKYAKRQLFQGAPPIRGVPHRPAPSHEGGEVELGERGVVEAEQQAILKQLLADYASVKRTGGDDLLDFLEKCVEGANVLQSELQKMFGAEAAAGKAEVKMWGRAGIFVATVNLGATVTRKVLANLTGPIGWGIDLMTDVTAAGIETSSQGPDEQFKAEVAKVTKKLVKRGAKEFDKVLEMLYKVQGGGVTEDNVESLEKEIKRLEGWLHNKALNNRSLKKYGSKQWVRYMKRAEELDRLRPLLREYKAALLPLRGARWLAERGAGKVIGGAFLAWDINEAFNVWNSHVQQFDWR